MKISGIICEYNPMHSGHVYHIEETRKNGATHIVCVMSSNFVQRGECAFIDKHLRAEIAVRNGADLVIELPTPWSCSSAHDFASAGVFLLNSIGAEELSFGCECGDVSALKDCSNILFSEEISTKITEKIKSGLSYPSALSDVVSSIYGEDISEIISSPNNTLAVEYINAITALNCKMEPFAVLRRGNSHNDNSLEGENISAGAIRKSNDINAFRQYMSSFAFEKISSQVNEGLIGEMNSGEKAVLSHLRRLSKEKMALYCDKQNGISDRIFSASKNATNLDELYNEIKTKNITMAAVRRNVLRIFLGIKPEISRENPPYIKILAASSKGLEILKQYRGELPIITKFSEVSKQSDFCKEIYALECLCSDLYGLFSKKIRACNMDKTSSVKIIK
ncbi:MAG: nucleotidyltransferase family protein [Clostridia bacterium]|nr:nucleotidyltransferase family protein [Clostridia bacterium]